MLIVYKLWHSSLIFYLYLNSFTNRINHIEDSFTGISLQKQCFWSSSNYKESNFHYKRSFRITKFIIKLIYLRACGTYYTSKFSFCINTTIINFFSEIRLFTFETEVGILVLTKIIYLFFYNIYKRRRKYVKIAIAHMLCTTSP